MLNSGQGGNWKVKGDLALFSFFFFFFFFAFALFSHPSLLAPTVTVVYLAVLTLFVLNMVMIHDHAAHDVVRREVKDVFLKKKKKSLNG
jgi:hypothetical protein